MFKIKRKVRDFQCRGVRPPPRRCSVHLPALGVRPPAPDDNRGRMVRVGGATEDGRRGEKRVFLLPAAAAPAQVASGTEGSGGGGGVAGRWEELFKTPFEADGAHVAAAQGAVHVLLKEPPVVLQHLRRLLVERVLGVGFLGEGQGAGFNQSGRCWSRYKGGAATHQKQVLQAVDDGVYRQHWFPVFPAETEAGQSRSHDPGELRPPVSP